MDKKSSKHSFTLKSINTEKVENTYGLFIQSNIQRPNGYEPPQNSTKISELQVSMEPEIINYLDEAKKMRKCIPTMISHFNNKLIPDTTNIYCFWCRHEFCNIPIGCPIRYVSSQLEKKYISEITRDGYQIKENVDCESIEKNTFNHLENIELLLHQKNYYESDGIFCSFNCCLSFIEENKTNQLYKNSKSLLFKIYRDVFDTSPTNLIPAPSWRLLKVYGGHLSINDYRQNLNRNQYFEHNKISSRPKFSPIGILFEEKSRF